MTRPGAHRSVLASALGILATLVAGVAGPQPSARADVAWVGPSPNGVLGPLVVAGDDGGNPRVLARPRLPSYAYPLSEPPMVAPGLGDDRPAGRRSSWLVD